MNRGLRFASTGLKGPDKSGAGRGMRNPRLNPEQGASLGVSETPLDGQETSLGGKGTSLDGPGTSLGGQETSLDGPGTSLGGPEKCP